MKFPTFPPIQRRRLQNIDLTEHGIPAPATRNASFQTLLKFTTPANISGALTNSCACRVFCNRSKSLRLPREKHFQLQKTPRDRQFLTILISKSIARAGVAQILRSSTSKSAPTVQRGVFFAEIALEHGRRAIFAKLNFKKCSETLKFSRFNFRIAPARRRGANFAKINFQKCSEPASF